MCVLNRDVKFKGDGGVLITTAALKQILQGHEKKMFWLYLIDQHGFSCSCWLFAFQIKVDSGDVLLLCLSLLF